MSRRLVICADDFGRSAVINEAVLGLGRQGKLSAASVMVDEPYAEQGASGLVRLAGFHIGLHLTLVDSSVAEVRETLARAGVAPTIDRLTLDAFRGRVPLAVIEAEVTRQFDVFERLFARPPDFIDAHQHAHLLPGIRTVLLDIAARRNGGLWVRSCEDDFISIARRGGDRLRAWRSAWLSRGLRRDALARGLRTNDGFSGLYDLRAPGAYQYRFPTFMRCPGATNHLIAVHPATAAQPDDPIGPARLDEFVFLSRTPIAEMAAIHGLEIGGLR
ncbi:ChbG/HpnK family deacetylase [Sphingomonas koreensis]